MTTVSGDKTAYATTTSCMAHVQPLDAEKAANYDGVFGKTFRIWIEPDIDIAEGDQLRDTTSSDVFKVKKGGITRRTFGSFDYMAVIIEKVN